MPRDLLYLLLKYHVIVYRILKNTIKANHLKYSCEKYFKQDKCVPFSHNQNRNHVFHN